MAVISEPYKRLNILIMVVKILGNSDTTAYKEAERVVKSLGLAVWNETYFFVDVAIAPLLIERVSNEELAEPNLGTLIFHPSPLRMAEVHPRYAGRIDVKNLLRLRHGFGRIVALIRGTSANKRSLRSTTTFDRGSFMNRRSFLLCKGH